LTAGAANFGISGALLRTPNVVHIQIATMQSSKMFKHLIVLVSHHPQLRNKRKHVNSLQVSRKLVVNYGVSRERTNPALFGTRDSLLLQHALLP
jgi:hypothetical protein